MWTGAVSGVLLDFLALIYQSTSGYGDGGAVVQVDI